MKTDNTQMPPETLELLKRHPEALKLALDSARELERLQLQQAEDLEKEKQLRPILGDATASRWAAERRADIERETARIESVRRDAVDRAQLAERQAREEAAQKEDQRRLNEAARANHEQLHRLAKEFVEAVEQQFQLRGDIDAASSTVGHALNRAGFFHLAHLPTILHFGRWT